MEANYGIFANVNKNTPASQDNNPSILPVRVTDIILSEDKLISGSWDSLGTIFYESFYEESEDTNNPNNYAKPYFPNIKNYPLIGELVYIISLPDPSNSDNPKYEGKYYLNPINVWNHPHHNAFPKLNFDNIPENVKLDYKEIETGLVRKEADQTNSFKFGDTFVERSNIKPLLPFEGDYLIEGRWGQSLRFGSTVKDKNIWSKGGEENGLPITILRNGQSKGSDPNKGWIPTLENINNDMSSLWMTQGQTIPINVSSNNLKSYAASSYSPPPFNKFNNNQIILNSNRLLFNGREDIFFTSKQTIGLSTEGEVHINSKKSVVINSSVIQLGLDAKEPLLLGDKTVKLLNELLSKLDALANGLSQLTVFQGGIEVPHPAIFNQANNLKKTTSDLLTSLNSITSSVNYTN